MTSRPHQFARDSEHNNIKPPPINVRYFYASPLFIDDPLSAVPPPTTSTTASTKLAPRPFSHYDSTQLDIAWNELRRKLLKHREERDSEKAAAARSVSEQHGRKRSAQYYLQEARTWPREPSQARSRDASTSRNSFGTSVGKDGIGMSMARKSLDEGYPGRARAGSKASLKSPATDLVSPIDMASSDEARSGLTGMPFARAPVRGKAPTSSKRSSMNVEKELGAEEAASEGAATPPKVPEEPQVKMPVGVSRLHQVVMPKLEMEPIYWSPVHDIASVTRGTWFYKDSMLPVEVDVSQMLEAGYLALQPWTDTWSDQLNSAVEAGAAGEEKVVHPLWPADLLTKAVPGSRPSTAMSTAGPLDEATPEQKRIDTLNTACDIIDATTGSETDLKAAGSLNFGQDGIGKLYLRSSIIYADAKEAYILRPNLQPSAYYGRRPLANYIKKGYPIGIPVVRGFNQAIWDKLHPAKGGKKATQAQEGVSTSQGGRPAAPRLRSDPALSKAERPRVTDLVLVIHGIGQKLSERMESFHFTHAMNGFRREVNVELGNNEVKPHLHKDAGGIMVLPVNWRVTLKMEEGGYNEHSENSNSNHYNIKDITPDSLAAVRGIIADVMLDVPYYLSHHQPTMIAAVIREANRIHRLWCLNNPGFEEHGRVHLLAHSLGSVMAVDILSKQPTSVPASLALSEPALHPEHFSFNTSNLYLCGSPAGLFLLLKQANILPRRDRHKAGFTIADYNAPGVSGEQGTYGCLAVDNIYNIINPYDPVALKLNATVDTLYAASLKSTRIPSTSQSWFSLPTFTRTSSGRPPLQSTASSSTTLKPRPSLPHLPSNVELETHNFTRSELAEKRFHLLNDNGTIDFFLRYGGGALEIQYLTMLGAHSSYWLSRDFVRFVVLETARQGGREGTIEAVRAERRRVRGR